MDDLKMIHMNRGSVRTEVIPIQSFERRLVTNGLIEIGER